VSSAFNPIVEDHIVLFSLPPGKYALSIGLIEGPPPPNLKGREFLGRGIQANPEATKSVFSPHVNTPFTAAVGAAFEKQTFNELITESFSSGGGVPIFFDREGKPFDEPQIYQKPNFVGPDVSLMNKFDASSKLLMNCILIIFFAICCCILYIHAINENRGKKNVWNTNYSYARSC